MSSTTPAKYFKNIEPMTTNDPIKNCTDFFWDIFYNIKDASISNKTKSKYYRQLKTENGRELILNHLADVYRIEDRETWKYKIISNSDFNLIMQEMSEEFA